MTNLSSSSLVSSFKEAIDPISTARNLLSRFDNSQTKQLTVESHQYLKTLAKEQMTTKLTKFNATPEQLKAQQNLFKITATAHQLKASELSHALANDFSDFVTEYADKIHKARISLELSYQMNNVIHTPDELLSKLKLTDASPARQVSQRLMTLSTVINQLTDIKALVHESVQNEDDLGQTLIAIKQHLFNEKSLYPSAVFDTTKLHSYLEVNSGRVQHAVMSAKDSEYNNMRCAELFTSICKLTTNLEKLQFQWLIERPRYSTEQPRLFQSLSQLPHHEYDSDQVDPTIAMTVRLSRIHHAMDLLTHVVYPCVLTELVSLEKVYSEIGNYKYLKIENEDVVTQSYSLDQNLSENTNYLSFLQNKMKSPHPKFILGGIDYCLNKLTAVTQQCEKNKNIFTNLKTDTPLEVSSMMLSYPAETMDRYLSAWTTKYQDWNNYFKSIMSVQNTITTWKSLQLDTEQWTTLDNLDKNQFHFTKVSQPQELSAPYRYQSPYRVGKENLEKIKPASLGYQELTIQNKFKADVTEIDNQSQQLKLNLNLFKEMISKFETAQDQNTQANMYRCYVIVNDLVNQLTFTVHDLTVVQSAYFVHDLPPLGEGSLCFQR